MPDAMSRDPEVRRVQAYDGEGDCVLDVGVIDQINADWLTDFLRGATDFDIYDDPMPSMDPRSHAAGYRVVAAEQPVDIERVAAAWGNVMAGRRIGQGLNAARIDRDTTTAEDWRNIAEEYKWVAAPTEEERQHER